MVMPAAWLVKSKVRSHEGRLWTIAALALALGGSAAVWADYAHDMAQITGRLESGSTVTESPFGPIEYASVGSGPVVLAIHGSGGGFDQAIEMMGDLAPRGYRLIAPSRFGYLRSGRPGNASPEIQADALAWLVEHLGEDEVFVAGGSAGALPAMQFAIRHPDKTRALVLLVPAAYAPRRAPNESAMGGAIGQAVIFTALRSDFLFWAAIRLFPDRMTRALLATEPALLLAAGPDERARVRAILSHILPVSRRARGLIDDSSWAGAPPRYALENIQAPVLTISARDDLYGTYEAAAYTAREVKNGRLLPFETGGHLLVGHQSEVWDRVSAFLDDVAAGAAAIE